MKIKKNKINFVTFFLLVTMILFGVSNSFLPKDLKNNDSNDDYIINTVQDLKNLKDGTDKTNIVLNNDIYIHENYFSRYNHPIITANNHHFEGNNHTINYIANDDVGPDFVQEFYLFKSIDVEGDFFITDLKLDGFLNFAKKVTLEYGETVETPHLSVNNVVIKNKKFTNEKNLGFFGLIVVNQNVNQYKEHQILINDKWTFTIQFDFKNIIFENSSFLKDDDIYVHPDYYFGILFNILIVGNKNQQFYTNYIINIENILVENNEFYFMGDFFDYPLLGNIIEKEGTNSNDVYDNEIYLKVSNIIFQQNEFLHWTKNVTISVSLFWFDEIIDWKSTKFIDPTFNNILFINNKVFFAEGGDILLSIIYFENTFSAKEKVYLFTPLFSNLLLIDKDINEFSFEFSFLNEVVSKEYIDWSNVGGEEANKLKNYDSINLTIKSQYEIFKKIVEVFKNNEIYVEANVDSKGELIEFNFSFLKLNTITFFEDKNKKIREIKIDGSAFLNGKDTSKNQKDVDVKNIKLMNEHQLIATIDDFTLKSGDKLVYDFKIDESKKLTFEDIKKGSLSIKFDYSWKGVNIFYKERFYKERIKISRVNLVNWDTGKINDDILKIENLNPPIPHPRTNNLAWYWILLIIITIILIILLVAFFYKKQKLQPVLGFDEEQFNQQLVQEEPFNEEQFNEEQFNEELNQEEPFNEEQFNEEQFNEELNQEEPFNEEQFNQQLDQEEPFNEEQFNEEQFNEELNQEEPFNEEQFNQQLDQE